MSLRTRFTDEMKASMKAGNLPRTSTIRMVMAKLKDTDIAARPAGRDPVPDDDITAMLRSMVKQRREAVALYTQGNRPELAAKEEAEIAVIGEFLPRKMDEATLTAAVDRAVAETGATTAKEMGRVMAALKATYGADLDLGAAGPLVKARLVG